MTMPSTENGLRKRVSKLEENFAALLGELNRKLSEMEKESSIANEVINALTQLVGEDDVKRVIEETQLKRRREQEAVQAANIAKLVDVKVLVPREESDHASIVVTKETNPDGLEVRGQYTLSKITNPQALSLLVGKKLGDTIELNGTKAVVAEVYEYDSARADQVVAEEQQKAKEAQEAAERAALAKSAGEQVDMAAIPAETATETTEAKV